VDSGAYEAATLGWAAADPNPDPFPYWHSSQVPPRGVNIANYSNPSADRLMEEAHRELDPEKREAIYHRLHRVFREDPPVVFIVNATQKYAFRRRVRGLITSPLGLFGFSPGPLSWWGALDGDASVSRK
jgi:peptide/nickel transport system substrate-binding protein